MEKDLARNMKQACVLAGIYFGENYNIEQLMFMYESEINEVMELLKKDKEFGKLNKVKQIDYISNLIIGLRIRNIALSLIEPVPEVDDEYVYQGYVSEIYDDILDDLGVVFDRYNMELDNPATLISRVRKLENTEQEEVIESYVRKRNY